MNSSTLFEGQDEIALDIKPIMESPTKEHDKDLWETLEKVQPNANTIQSEIDFLTQYAERFGFKQDLKRLYTLKAFQTQQN